jgi:hypothetical protein
MKRPSESRDDNYSAYEVPNQQTYVSYCDIVQISPI